jgi:hypothetical protein
MIRRCCRVPTPSPGMRAAALAECSDQSKAATHCRIVTLTLGRRG